MIGSRSGSARLPLFLAGLLGVGLVAGAAWLLGQPSEDVAPPVASAGEGRADDDERPAERAEQQSGGKPALTLEDTPRSESAGAEERLDSPVESEVALPGEQVAVSTRTPSELGVFGGRLVDGARQPIAGARITWRARGIEGQASDDELEVESDEDGRFWFEREPAEVGTGSVLWASHADFLALKLELPRKREDRQRRDHEMERATGIRARVLSNGELVAGAEVTQVLEPEVPTGLRRVYVTEADGSVRLHPVSGEVRIVAASGEQCAAPWRGSGTEDVTLHLGGSFGAVGRLDLPEVFIEHRIVLEIVCYALQGPLRTPVGKTKIDEQGRWELGNLPLLAGTNASGNPIVPDGYAFRVEYPGAVPDESWIEPPPANSIVEVDLDAIDGTPIWIYPIDESGESVFEAVGIARWDHEGHLEEVRATVREDGYMPIVGCRKGIVHFEIRAPGYEPHVSQPYELPMPEAGTFRIELKRGRRISGRVVANGEPVPNFELQFHRVDDPTKHTSRVRFEGLRDGEFSVDIPRGPTTGVAVVRGVGQSELVDFEDGMVLDVLPVRVGLGKVLDRLSREPIPGSQAHTWFTIDRGRSTRSGLPQAVAADGYFRVEAVDPREGLITLEAPGYARSEVWPRSKLPDGSLVYGTILMDRSSQVTLRLIPPAHLEPTEFRAELDQWGLDAYSRYFPPEGELEFDLPQGIRTGFSITHDVERWHASGACELPVDGGEQTDPIVLDLTGTSALEVEFRNEEELAGSWYNIELRIEQEVLDYWSRSGTFPIGEAAFPYLSGGAYEVTVEGVDGGILGGAAGVLGPGERQPVVIDFASPRVTFEVFDAEGEPLTGGVVAFYRDQTFYRGGSTDAEGRIYFAQFDPGEYDVFIEGVDVHGTMLAVPIVVPGGEPDEDEPIRLDFLPEVWVFVEITGPEGGLDGLEPKIWDAKRQRHSVTWRTDAQGTTNSVPFNPGSAILEVEPFGYFPVRHHFEVTPGMAPVAVRAHRACDLALTLVDENGARLSHLDFELTGDFGDHTIAELIAKGEHVHSSTGALRTDGLGQVELEGVPEGDLRVSATLPSGDVRVATVRVVAGEENLRVVQL